VSDIASPEPVTLSDEAILARFQATKNAPKGSQLVGFRMLSVEQATRTVEVAFDASEQFCNPMRQIQGGYLCVMLDECMSVACMVASGMTSVAPTLEMKTSFFRPAMPGPMRGIGRVVRWGKTVAFTEGELYDAVFAILCWASFEYVVTE